MASRLANICLDAHDTFAQARWWAEVLDDFVFDPDDTQEGWNHPGAEESGLESVDGARSFLFLAVPEGKQVKNRVHPCLRPTDRSRDEEIARLLDHGATLVNDLRDGEQIGRAHV